MTYGLNRQPLRPSVGSAGRTYRRANGVRRSERGLRGLSLRSVPQRIRHGDASAAAGLDEVPGGVSDEHALPLDEVVESP